MIGTWQNGKGHTFTINSDNTLIKHVDAQSSQPLKITIGTANSAVPYLDTKPDSGVGFSLALFKIGFKNPTGEQSDTSIPRNIGTQNSTNFPSEMYYYKK